MKFDKIRLSSANEVYIADLSFQVPSDSSPYVARAIDGLGASEIVPKFYGNGTTTKFNNMMPSPRELAFRIVLNPNFSLEQSYSKLRDDLYRSIASTRSGLINVIFYDDDVEVARTSGHVVKYENALFNRTQEVVLGIRCLKPYFYGETISEGFISAPTYPLSITDLKSTAPHGFRFVAKFTTDQPDFIMTDTLFVPDWAFTVTPGVIGLNTGFLVDDEIHFSSVLDNKYLYIIRDTFTIHLADKIVGGSTWPLLFPGVNEFNVTPEDLEWLEFEHEPSYWGA